MFSQKTYWWGQSLDMLVMVAHSDSHVHSSRVLGCFVVQNLLVPFLDYGNFPQYGAVLTRNAYYHFVQPPDFVDRH